MKSCFICRGAIPGTADPTEIVLCHACAEMFKSMSAKGWISMRDRLPNEKGVYLVYAPDYKPGSSRGQPNHNGIMFSYWNGTAWGIEINGGYRYRKSIVRYWMPLPEAPHDAP